MIVTIIRIFGINISTETIVDLGSCIPTITIFTNQKRHSNNTQMKKSIMLFRKGEVIFKHKNATKKGMIKKTGLNGRNTVYEKKQYTKEISRYFKSYLIKPIKKAHLYRDLLTVFERRKTSDKFKSRKVLIDDSFAKNFPHRILLAEDNLINQKVAERLLSKLGYKIDIVSNGLEAFKAVKKIPYDIVLMDVQMPELGGIQATQKIRKEIEKEKQPIIIALTAHAFEGDKEKCLDAGMDDYLSKPAETEKLIEKLKKYSKD